MSIFFFLVFIVFTLMHSVVLFWFCQNTAGLSLTAFVKILPVILTLVYFLLYVLARKLNLYFLESFLLTYLGALFLAFSLVFAIIILTLVLKMFHITLPLFSSYLVLAVWLIMLSASLYTAAKTPKITALNIDAPALKQDVKIAFITDTHFGATVSPKRAESVKQILQEQKPDLIVFGGDIFETNSKESKPYTDILKSIMPGKKFGVFGNHEYYQGLKDSRESFKQAGITLLENQSIAAEDINIIGVNDIKTTALTKQNFENILKKEVKQNKFDLLLTHSPLYFKVAAQNGVDLMLSGHTHKGQIWPFSLMVKAAFPYFNGLYEEGKAKLFVSAGTFFWGPPLRLFSENEIVFITLKGQKD